MAATSGQRPPSKHSNLSIDWWKMFRGRDPNQELSNFFTEVYSLEEDEGVRENEMKRRYVNTWLDLRIDLRAHRFSVRNIKTAISKLKLGKSSPDGVTAEMFRALPEKALAGLSEHFTSMFSSLDIPRDWTIVTATLIAKVVGASCLSKFRAIACFSTVRKFMGYLLLQMMPTLTFRSFQTGFVPGGQAAFGVFALSRAGELSREWNQRIFVVQLDLRKAFDRVRHSAVLAALKLQGASLQLVALVSQLLTQNDARIRLGHASSTQVPMARGLPQGAPESPLLFILVVEMVLRPLLDQWQHRGRGWNMDSLWLQSVNFADDILLVSSSNK